MQRLHVVIITGLSGAGKSQALRAMEDLNFFCVDNLPPNLLSQFVLLFKNQENKDEQDQRLAICIDIRAGSFFYAFQTALEQLQVEGICHEILYLDSSDEVLLHRFKETRRPHPLALQGRVQEGILLERQIIEPLKKQATHIINTAQTTAQQLRNKIRELYAASRERSELMINITSFGFKHGLPADADLVFDMRFIPNPHWIPELRPLSGLDSAVYDYVMQQEVTEPFLEQLCSMIDFLIPQFTKEGRNNIVIAIGCTGGQHRSVSIARYLASYLLQKDKLVKLEHRELEASESEVRNR